MRYLLSLFSILALLIQTGFSQSNTNKFINISFGKSSKVVFNKAAGSYDVFSNQKLIISGAFSEVKSNDQVLKSTEYQFADLKITPLQDGFGTGKKYIITLKKTNQPVLQQVFYVYPHLDYFFAEVVLIGKELKSNYMSPLSTSKVDLQAIGDNRNLFVPFDNDTFIRYNAKSAKADIENTSAEVGAFYENESRNGLILGSVEHMVWKTGIRSKGKSSTLSNLVVWGGYTEESVTRDKIEHGYISGAALKSPKIFIGYFSDWRTGLEAYGKANRIEESPYVFNWTKPTPFGWNSWGVIQEKLSYEKAIKVTDFFADELPAFRNGGEAYIDLDSFWDNFTGGMSGDFSKLKEFADYCKSKGMQPGVYWAPFTDWGYKSKNERKAEGSDYKFSEMWTKVNNGYHDFDGARALDPTHPGTLRRIDYIIDKLKACGFSMIKIDFLGHAAAESSAFHDKSVKTGMQAYRVGMEYLVNRLDGQMLIYAAISPSLATGRYAHIRRIACDAWKTIKDTEYTLNSVTFGWWQTHLYNFIDADHIVFGTEGSAVNRARMASAIIAGPIITGDDYATDGPWKQEAKALLQNKSLLEIVKNGKSFKPVEGNTGSGASDMFVKVGGKYLYVAVLNYTANNKDLLLPLKKLGLGKNQYQAIELFSSKQLVLKTNASISIPASDAIILKVAL
ncbi:MAG: alpha-galactosidase [Pedobacter sp.]|nr:MAG: alpha-galactosidase [Pedobacter sp.]